ncbi:sugar transporter protein [Rutstroemia sp. NJR-2017a BBW]|nr:sugar transporter protein [Rutstroemia sp. NJR-2017a BBW]PQE08604.1 sugar transporter protein [Rutstroemia sp. NJR-2017a BBW]
MFAPAPKVNAQILSSSSPLTNKRGPWWNDRGLRTLNFLIFIPLMSEYVQGYDASLINNVQQLKSWQTEFHNPHGSLLGIMSASYWVGNVLGVFFITPLSDRFGRRMAMFFGSVVAVIGTALCTGAVEAGMFIVGRLLLGIGGVVVGAIGPVLVAELAYPDHRATATALSNTQYSMGSIIAAWITFGTFRLNSTWSWRIPSIFQALPSLLQALGIFFLPESPRWLVSKGREEAALDLLAKYHANGDREDEVVQFEFREIVGTIEMEIAAKKTRWRELIKGRGNLWRAGIMIVGCLSLWGLVREARGWFGICKQWSGNGVVSYYLHTMLNDVGIKSTFQQTLITATSSMFSFACSVGFAFLPARVGRRPLLLWSMALMWLVFTIITILTGVFTYTKSKSASYASVAFIYLYSGVHNLGWTGAMMVYVVEILPYSMRAKGLAGAFNTYVNPLGLDRFGWKFYFFYVGWIAVEFVVVYFACPETMGTSLEDVALIIEGDKALVGKMDTVKEKALKEDAVDAEHVEKVE